MQKSEYTQTVQKGMEDDNVRSSIYPAKQVAYFLSDLG
jgi:hypothetical protein